MRTTRTKSKDCRQMLLFAGKNINSRAVDAIDNFSAQKRFASHRAAKVFWSLVDDGFIVVGPGQKEENS